MTAAINLNDYIAVGAIKINYVVAYYFLSIKIIAFELFISYLLPKQYF